MNDVFRAGVEPGGLTMDYEIKVLICYLLSRLDSPMPAAGLCEVLTGEGIANYFEAASAASGLLKSGHLCSETGQDGELCYQITDLGRGAAATFEKDLPSTVRQKALDAARRHLLMRRRKAHNKVRIKRVEDGYQLSLSISDVGSNLLDLTVLLPDEETCERVRDRFFDDPVAFYQGMLNLMTGGEL